VTNGTLHEPHGEPGAFCGTVAAHRLAELKDSHTELLEALKELLEYTPQDHFRSWFEHDDTFKGLESVSEQARQAIKNATEVK
jgi:hypothetical protein